MANDKYTSALTQEELEIITEYIEERSKEMIEEGKENIKDAIKDALVEKLYSLGHQKKDAIRTVLLITDGGNEVDFEKKLNLPEDSKVAAKFYDIFEKYDKISSVYEGVQNISENFNRMDELKDHMKPDGTYDREGKELLEDTLYKFLDNVKDIVDKIPGSKYYKELIGFVQYILPGTIDNCKNWNSRNDVGGWYLDFDDDDTTARRGADGQLYEELSDASLAHAILQLTQIDWNTFDEEIWLQGPSVMQIEYLIEEYPDEVDIIGVYVEWRFAYELELERKNHEIKIKNKVTDYINAKKTSAAELLFKYNKNAPTENEPPTQDEEKEQDKKDIKVDGNTVKKDNIDHFFDSTFSSSTGGSGGSSFGVVNKHTAIHIKKEIDIEIDEDFAFDVDGFTKDIKNFMETDPETGIEMYNALLDSIEYMKDELSEDEIENLEDIANDLANEFPNLSNELYNRSKQATPPCDPLIIDLDTNLGIQLTDVENGVHFDVNKNGFAERTVWTSGKDGFLCIDRNGNGIIDDGGELFGDYVIKNDGSRAKDGFDALKDFDDNINEGTDKIGDNIIDKNDARFNELKVWIDENHNGITDKGELKSLAEHNIKSISLEILPPTENEENEEDPNKELSDNYFNAVVELTNGTTRISEHWFDVKPYDTEERDETGKTIISNSVQTFGNVKNLDSAIADDDTGVLEQLVKDFRKSNNYAEKRVILKKILFFITDSNTINSNERGGNIDARELNVIEKFMGTEFIGVDGSKIPNSVAAPILKEVYNKIETMYFNLLNKQTDIGTYLNIITTYTDENNNKKIDFSLFNRLIILKMLNGEDVKDTVIGIASWLKESDKVNGTNEFEAFISDYNELTEGFHDIPDLLNVNNVYFGENDDDNLKGYNENEILWGDSGNDTISAGNGNDFIYGGTGDDTMNGGDGDDSYYIDANHGNDVIRDTKGDNKIYFTDGLSVEDYEASINAKLGFVLTNKETGETVSLPDFLTNPLNYNFNFEGGSDTEESITNREVFEGTAADDYIETGDGFNISYGGDGDDTLAGGKDIDFMYGGNGDDLLLGRNGVNVLFGEEGNDTIYDGDHGSYLNGGNGDDMLYGGGGADVLDGGAGNDYLQGDHGNDTYIFGKGYDTDTINASSDVNTIIIKGYNASSMINTRNANNDLIIHFGSEDSTDCLIVDHFFDYNSNRDIRFEFDNGTVLGQYDIKAKYAPIEGTENSEWMGIQTNDDMIYRGYGGHDGIGAGNGNDTLDGGTGNDVLNGGNGTDTYIFAKGYGNDSVNEWGTDKSIIKFTDINSDEVAIVDQWGNLLVTVNDTEDTLTINSFKWGQSTYSFEFADGAIASVNKDTFELEFSKLPDIPEVSEDEIAQTNAELLSELYAEDTLSTELISETDNTIISDVTDSTTVADETDEIADQTDLQVMILTENMSAFADEDNVSDGINVADASADVTAMNQLLVNSVV